MENSLSSPFEAEKDVTVVIEEATIDEGGEVSGEFFNLQSSHVFGEVFGVCADVAHAASCAGPFWIGAPCGLLLVFFFQRSG